MKLFAVIIWFDESPTWLAGCVASLSRIGVDHVVAVDGRFPHFDPSAPAASPMEQQDAIFTTAASAGMGVTTVRPTAAELMEPGKRELAHRLVGVLGVPMRDWFLVIDADEYIADGSQSVRNQLAAISDGTHAAACRVGKTFDPYGDPDADEDLNHKTLELHLKMPLTSSYASMQSRFWRVMHDMRVGPAHHQYTGLDRSGVRWALRPDIGADLLPGEQPRTDIAQVDGVGIMHRANWRSAVRRATKDAYYTLRDDLGIERPVSVAT